METRKYKTLAGLIRQTNYKQLTAEDFFSGEFYHRSAGWCKFVLPADEKRRAAEMFAKYLFSTLSARRGLADALCEGRGDFSFLQSFIFTLSQSRGIYVGTTLSGPGFEFCRRGYKKSI